jgi:hypothetical protein
VSSQQTLTNFSQEAFTRNLITKRIQIVSMESISKGFSLLLVVILAVSSLMMVESASAQSIHKPSVPEFSLKYVDRSYDTQPTYGLDPYTGKNVVTHPSEHIDNRTIEITIKNQPFTQFTDSSNGKTINLFYNVRYKGSFGTQWTLLFGEQVETVGGSYLQFGYPIQDYSSQYTIIIFHLPNDVRSGQMDIQVQAMEGYTNASVVQSHIFTSLVDYIFYGEQSGWTNTQTITIGQTSATTTPNPTPTPAVPEFPMLTIPILIVTIVVAGLLVYIKKHRRAV